VQYDRVCNAQKILHCAIQEFTTRLICQCIVLSYFNVSQILSFSNTVCELLPNLGQYGLYELAVQNNTCSFRTMKNPTYPYTGKFLNILKILYKYSS